VEKCTILPGISTPATSPGICGGDVYMSGVNIPPEEVVAMEKMLDMLMALVLIVSFVEWIRSEVNG